MKSEGEKLSRLLRLLLPILAFALFFGQTSFGQLLDTSSTSWQTNLDNRLRLEIDRLNGALVNSSSITITPGDTIRVRLAYLRNGSLTNGNLFHSTSIRDGTTSFLSFSWRRPGISNNAATVLETDWFVDQGSFREKFVTYTVPEIINLSDQPNPLQLVLEWDLNFRPRYPFDDFSTLNPKASIGFNGEIQYAKYIAPKVESIEITAEAQNVPIELEQHGLFGTTRLDTLNMPDWIQIERNSSALDLSVFASENPNPTPRSGIVTLSNSSSGEFVTAMVTINQAAGENVEVSVKEIVKPKITFENGYAKVTFDTIAGRRHTLKTTTDLSLGIDEWSIATIEGADFVADGSTVSLLDFPLGTPSINDKKFYVVVVEE